MRKRWNLQELIRTLRCHGRAPPGPILSDNSNVGSIYVLLSKWIFERPGETKSSDVNVSTVDPSNFLFSNYCTLTECYVVRWLYYYSSYKTSSCRAVFELMYYFRFMMSFSDYSCTCWGHQRLRSFCLFGVIFLDFFVILEERVLLIYIVCNNLIPIILNQMYLRCLRLNWTIIS